MILARQVFQVKFGHMDDVLKPLKEMARSGQASGTVSRVLTDLSGKNFTLVFETKAESMDAFWQGLQASFSDPEMASMNDFFLQYIESGYREFYTIEYEEDN